MRPWQLLWKFEALMVVLMMLGCSATAPGVRVEAGGQGTTLIYIARSATVEPVRITQEETAQSLQRLAREVRLTGSPRETVEQLLQLDVLYGEYLYLLQEHKLLPQDSGAPLEGGLTEAEQRWVLQYKSWCRSVHRFDGDCLGGALVAGKYLDLRGRYMWAMALSKSPVLEEFEKALGHMVSMWAVIQAALWTVVTLLILLTLPEPITKFIAAWATAALIFWVGAKTLYSLMEGWFQLMQEVQEATTFEQLREAGEKFGRLFSREAAQAFAMLAMALLTHTAKDFAQQLGTLPGSAQVSMQADAQGGLLLSEVGAVESVAVTADGFSVAMAPGAMVMAAGGGRGNRTQKHHIGTIANKQSSLRGGPWTPRFERLFARAGMRLQDAENVVLIRGHKGPHPLRYHEIIYRRLRAALGDCSAITECRENLTRELRALAEEISTPGTELNRLVTVGK
jgi:hypothetical protein